MEGVGGRGRWHAGGIAVILEWVESTTLAWSHVRVVTGDAMPGQPFQLTLRPDTPRVSGGVAETLFTARFRR